VGGGIANIVHRGFYQDFPEDEEEEMGKGKEEKKEKSGSLGKKERDMV